MAAALPAAAAVAAPPAPVQGPRSYREYYDDVANDPYEGHYNAVVARFSTVVAPVVNPQDLASEVYASTGSPSAFLLLCRPAYDPMGTGAAKIMLFHRLATYETRLGLPTPWDDLAFAFKGDVIAPHSDICTVIWSTNYFNQTAQLRVYTQDAHDQQLAGDPALDLLGPPDPADIATTETRRVRRCAYVPPKYVNLFLGQELAPREACERCCTAMETDGLSDTLSDLRFWLRAAMTRQQAGQESALIYAHPVLPPVVPEIVTHRRQLLFRDLPALSTTVVGQGAQLIAGAIGTVVDQQRQYREADEARRVADVKSPDSFLGSSVQSPLLRIAQVASSADLPPIWQEIAETPKAQRRLVIQRALDEALQIVVPGGGRSHVVTPSLAKKICDLEFRMTNPEDLSTGIQPFVLVQTTPAERQAAQSLVHVYDTVMAGAAASLTDAQHLISNDTALIPRTFGQARACLTYLRALVLVILGPYHPWTVALGSFLAQYSAREMELELVQPRDAQYRSLVPALMVQWIQLRWDDWLQSQWNSPADVPVPNVLELFSNIRVDTGWEPTIPAQYLQLRPPPVLIPRVEQTEPRGEEHNLGGAGRPPPGGPGTPQIRDVAVRNTAYLEADFAPFRQLPIRIRDLLVRHAATPPPISSHDNPAGRPNSREPGGWGWMLARLPCKPPKPKAQQQISDNVSFPLPAVTTPAAELAHTTAAARIRGKVRKPPLKKRRLAPLPDELGTLILRDSALLALSGWDGLVSSRQGRGDLSSPHRLRHPARRLLRQYRYRGAPVVLQTAPWPPHRCEESIRRGPHSSAYDHVDFLRDEFADMVNQGQWIILPYDDVRNLPNLRISPMGVVPQHERRPRTIVDYSYYGLNAEMVPIAPMDAMQFGNTLPRLLRHIVLADPAHGPVKLIKIDIADGFYRIGVRPRDVPKLGVAFPSGPDDPFLVAFPITLPMGWTNSPPIFCAATETIADLANEALLKWRNPPAHRLEAYASTPAAASTTDSSTLAPLGVDSLSYAGSMPYDSDGAAAAPGSHAGSAMDPPHCKQSFFAALNTTSFAGAASALPPPRLVPHDRMLNAPRHATRRLPPPLPTPLSRDPHLHHPRRRQLATVDVFVDDFIGAAQGNVDRLNRVRRILLTAVDQVFRPLDATDSPFRREPSSVKKMLQGDADWTTCKVVLGWLLDTTAMTLALTPRRLSRLAELLASIPLSQKRTSLKRWHQLLGELRSMTLAIPGARGLFSHMQEALRHRTPGHKIRLCNGVHDAIQDFRLLYDDLARRPTRLYELVPLAPTLVGSHDACGVGMGGVWFPTPAATCRHGTDPLSPSSIMASPPIVWRALFTADIVDDLVSWTNPTGRVTNSDLELAGSLVHHEAAVHNYDVRERTILSKTDNTPTLFWQRKGSTTTTGAPAYLLRAQALHQRHHRYIPRQVLEALDPLVRDSFRRDYELAQTAVHTGVTAKRASGADSHWQVWSAFCFDLALDPLLSNLEDPVALLQVFAHRYRVGTIAPKHKPVRSRTVEDALRTVGQTFTGLGQDDPRLTPQGKLDFRLQRMLASFKRRDPPPHRVKPIPVQVLRRIMAVAYASPTAGNLAIADMCCIAFFFLLRPGEYTISPSESTPFRICDVQLSIGHRRLDYLTASEADIRSATFATLTFTSQKNGVRGEVVGLARSGNPQLCPVLSLVNRLLHARSNNADPLTPLARYFAHGRWRDVMSADITTTLQQAVTFLGPTLGFLASDVSARSLRAAGAMALLCAQVDSDKIRMLGRWRSDEMLRYLHVQAEPTMRDFSRRMVHNGDYVLLPNNEVPFY